MNSCNFFVKLKNITIPSKFLLKKYYNQFKKDKITIIYNNGNYIFVDKSCNNFEELFDVLSNEILTEDNVVIILHDKEMYFNDCFQNNCFYKTKNQINISCIKNNFMDSINLINKQKYQPLFEMFLKNNAYIEMETHCIRTYGNFVNMQGYLTTNKIEITYPLMLTNN